MRDIDSTPVQQAGLAKTVCIEPRLWARGRARHAEVTAVLRRAAAAALAMHLASPVLADTSSVSASGFTVMFRPEVQATPAQAWLAIGQIGRWWNGQHTWSGQAANMSLELNAGGCWCERWGDARSVMHGQVISVQPGSVLRLYASLGPLQELATTGVLTFVTGVTDGKTRLRVTYRVAGSADAGLDKLAGPVDAVLGEQVQRLVNFIEKGQPQ